MPCTCTREFTTNPQKPIRKTSKIIQLFMPNGERFNKLHTSDRMNICQQLKMHKDITHK